MRTAVNDMGIYRHQTRAYFEGVLPRLNACRAVFLDANLSEEAIDFLAENVRVRSSRTRSRLRRRPSCAAR